tara:strand:+ start:263 stop:787 length:525 start_codon:yes stop_codon:yes gene_type:complete
MEWFKQKAKTMLLIRQRTQLMKEDELTLMTKPTSPIIGKMFMYFYDPKGKETLPYYDKFPLTIIVGKAPGGFYGLNLHYLPIKQRALLLNALMEKTSNTKFDETTRMKITYKLLKASARTRFFKPCFKHYLTKHVISKFAYVSSSDWEIATFLPTANWKKKKQAVIWKESRSKY